MRVCSHACLYVCVLIAAYTFALLCVDLQACNQSYNNVIYVGIENEQACSGQVVSSSEAPSPGMLSAHHSI